VLEVLGQAAELTEPAIRDRVGLDHRHTGPALRSLVADGSVTKLGAGRKGDPFRYALPGNVPSPDSSFVASAFMEASENQSEHRAADRYEELPW